MFFFVALYWSEDDEGNRRARPNPATESPSDHRVMEAVDEEDAIGKAAEYFGYDEVSPDEQPFFLAVPITGNPRRVRVRRTVEFV